MFKNIKKIKLTSFSILYIIMGLLALTSFLLKGLPFDQNLLTDKSLPANVLGANFSTFMMSTYFGFVNSVDICFFILVLGGFLAVVEKTGALEMGIKSLVNKMKNKELLLIPILMILFALGGTIYGMGEETLPFYTFVTSALVIAGFDTIVALGVVLLGSQSGTMASTLNPFAAGVATDSLKSLGINVNLGFLMFVEAIFWLALVIPCILYVYSYAKKIKKDKGKIILSKNEKELMDINFNDRSNKEEIDIKLTRKEKNVLYLFLFAFLIMIISLTPWQQFNITLFNGWSNFLTGSPLGTWDFPDLAMLFLLTGVLIGVIYKLGEKTIVDSFLYGTKDMLPVVLVIVVSRGISHLMTTTQLDLLILDKASMFLSIMPPILFIIFSYFIYIALSFLVPSSSALAYLSIPIMGSLAVKAGVAPELMIVAFTTGSGFVNTFSPTSAIVLGSLEINKVEYSTWVKFIKKLLLIFIAITVLMLSIFLIFNIKF